MFGIRRTVGPEGNLKTVSVLMNELEVKELKFRHEVETTRLKLDHDGKMSALKRKFDDATTKKDWVIEQACDEVRKALEKKCFTSDLLRVEAVARLETFMDIDSKEDHDKAMEYLSTLINGLAEMLKMPHTPADIHIHKEVSGK